MALEIADFWHAGAIVDGTQGIPLTQADPFLKNDGFQGFDPTSSVVPDGIKGGWTRVGDGNYLMRTLRGIDALESIIYVVPEEISFAGRGAMIPPVLAESIETAPDSTLLQVLIADANNVFDPIDALYTIQIFRLATGGLITDDIDIPQQ